MLGVRRYTGQTGRYDRGRAELCAHLLFGEKFEGTYVGIAHITGKTIIENCKRPFVALVLERFRVAHGMAGSLMLSPFEALVFSLLVLRE